MRQEAWVNMVVVTLAYIALFGFRGSFSLRIESKSDSRRKLLYRYLLGLLLVYPSFAFSNHTKTIIEWYSIVGNGYVHLLKLVAIPLISISFFRHQ